MLKNEKANRDEDLPYVFISYAKEDIEVAEKVEAFLSANGFRVFRDRKDIHSSQDIYKRIEKALRECDRMVLLLSPHSMPDHEEVYLEWINFQLDKKPIHSLFLKDCTLSPRLRTRKYLDARSDLQTALDDFVTDLQIEFSQSESMSDADRINVVETQGNDLPEPAQALYDAIQDPKGSVTFSKEQAMAIRDHKPANLRDYRLGRIAEWSLPRYYLDKRFVNLTLILDKGESEQQRWQKSEEFRFVDLREVLSKAEDSPALVLLGDPGSGKSTLLRRLQLDHSIDRLRDNVEEVSFFVQLNGYRAHGNGDLPEPLEWLNARWNERYPSLPKLENYLKASRVLLLLDALNEMPHKSPADYHRLVGLWKEFIQSACGQGNRIIFSCRSLDYSASLSSPELRVPQIEVQPMNADQMQTFLSAYIPAKAEQVWSDLDGSPQYSLFQTPYFLKLLCEQVEDTGGVPKGRAGLFTGFVRQVLTRECEKNELFRPDTLLDERDHRKLTQKSWNGSFDLPERGILIPKLSHLAFSMQVRGLETEGAQVRIGYDDACKIIDHDKAGVILKSGVEMNVLDEDEKRDEIAFFHQLLQEYFAARRLAKQPNPELVHVEWAVDKVSQSLENTIAGLADGDPLPPLPQTGWEETTLTAAPMAEDSEAFIRNLIPHNLPLAARCAASPELKISEGLKREIQDLLIDRTKDMQVDLRARIAAGEALGIIGDPRFELCEGSYGKYLLPPLVEIPGGKYPMGLNNAPYDREEPEHKVELESFQIGQFPVTNAEYAKFIAADGYENEQWWDTPESLKWLLEGGAEGSKQGWRDYRKNLQDNWTDEGLRDLVRQNRATSEQVEDSIETRNWTDEEFEQWLDDAFPPGKLYRQPEFWDDTRFNNHSQPVVGVTWFEARAYCNWLTANINGLGVPPSGAEPSNQAGRLKPELQTIFRLPTEAEFEATARGKKGRIFPYGKEFEVRRSNTFESHIRRSTPVGIFDNATPEGAFDISGNVYTWTLSIYDQEKFPYPYKKDDGREDINQTGVRRVLRGGSWAYDQDLARAVCRRYDLPSGRHDLIGFRVVSSVRPPSQKT